MRAPSPSRTWRWPPPRRGASSSWRFPSSALGALGRDLPFWIRLEYRILDGDGASDPADSGYTLQALIDALSRRRKTESSPHALEAGPFRLPRARSSSRR